MFGTGWEEREFEIGLEDGGDTCETSLISVMLWIGMFWGFFEDLQSAIGNWQFLCGKERRQGSIWKGNCMIEA